MNDDMPLLRVSGLSRSFPLGRDVLRAVDDVSFSLARCGSLGLVGESGCGKSTLVRLLTRVLDPTAGEIWFDGEALHTIPANRFMRRPQRRRIQMVFQDPSDSLNPRWSAFDAIADPVRRLLPTAGRGAVRAAVADAAALVGLPAELLGRFPHQLSGGQKARVGIARALAAKPDLLVLDEPTNNLDAGARDLVAEVLGRWKGGAIVVSHDRALLRRMDRIVELTSLGAQVYGGGYDLYEARKAEAEAAAARDLADAEKQAARIAREVQVVAQRKQRKDAAGKRARAKGDAPKILLDFRAGRAEASGGRGQRLAERLKADAAEALAGAEARVERVRRLAFDLPPSGLAAGKTVLAMDRVVFGHDGAPPLLNDVSLKIVGPERVAVSGRNGSGKTTLIRLAAGELFPSAGQVARGATAAFLDQQTALLGDDPTLVAAFRRLNPRASENGARAALARFLFRNAAAEKPVAALSGGERLRAALACVLLGDDPPQLLILDEPTNHLDLDSIGAVEAAISGYDGALLVVSHDRDFLAAIGIEREIALG